MKIVLSCLVCLALAALGCSGRSGARSSPAFPTRAELNSIRRRHADVRPSAPPAARVERWTLQGPFPAPTDADSAVEVTGWLRLLRSAVGLEVEATRATECASREVARFALAHEEPIPQDLMDFITVRCGVRGPASVAFSQRIPDVGDRSEADVLAALQQQTPARTATRSGAYMGSLAYQRDGALAVVVGVLSPRLASLAEPPRLQGGGATREVEITGRTLEPAAALDASITRGALGATECTRDPSVSLPDFRLRCVLAPGDREAWIDLYAARRGELLAHRLMTLSVQAEGEPDPDFTRDVGGDTVTVDATGEGLARARDVVNGIRASAGVSALQLAEAQSNELCAGLPVFVAASSGSIERRVADRIGLGMMAGWEVPEMIYDASFLLSAGAGTSDFRQSVAMALRHPGDRLALLGGARRWLALCPLQQDGRVTHTMWTTYSTLRDADRGAETSDALGKIAQAFGRASRPVPPVDAGLSSLVASEAHALETDGARDPGDVLNAILQEASTRYAARVMGWMLGMDADGAIEFPADFTATTHERFGAAVVHWRSPRAAWGQRVVFVVSLLP